MSPPSLSCGLVPASISVLPLPECGLVCHPLEADDAVAELRVLRGNPPNELVRGISPAMTVSISSSSALARPGVYSPQASPYLFSFSPKS